jgi:hypothetical protein
MKKPSFDSWAFFYDQGQVRLKQGTDERKWHSNDFSRC